MFVAPGFASGLILLSASGLSPDRRCSSSCARPSVPLSPVAGVSPAAECIPLSSARQRTSVARTLFIGFEKAPRALGHGIASSLKQW